MFQILLIGVISSILYSIVYFTQRAIFFNGLSLNFDGMVNQGAPANSAELWLQIGTYWGATIALFAVYGWLLILCRRGYFSDRKIHRILVLVWPLLLNISLLFGQPSWSIDLFNYMAYGYLGHVLPGSPYLHPAYAAIDTPLGPALVEAGWRPVHSVAPYGPLWTQIEVAVMGFTDRIPIAMVIFKSIVVAASLGSAVLIWHILGRVRPQDQLFGTLVYWWNPAILMEFAAEGHNDSVMILFVLAAVAFSVSNRSLLALGSILFGILTKYLPFVFLPPLFVYQWYTRRNDRDFVLQLLSGLILGLAALILFYGTPQVAIAAFKGLQMQTQFRISASPSGLLFWSLAQIYPSDHAAQLASLIWRFLLGVIVIWSSWHVRSFSSLLRALFILSLSLLLMSPIYWPWYVCMPLALAALLTRGILFRFTVLITICSRLVAPLDTLYNNGFLSWQVADGSKNLIGITLPLIGLLLWCLWNMWHQHIQHKPG